MEKNKTAVDLLKVQLETFGDPDFCKISWEDLDRLFEKAKKMEKKQIIDAYSNNGWNDEDEISDAEQYYKETFKSE